MCSYQEKVDAESSGGTENAALAVALGHASFTVPSVSAPWSPPRGLGPAAPRLSPMRVPEGPHAPLPGGRDAPRLSHRGRSRKIPFQQVVGIARFVVRLCSPEASEGPCRRWAAASSSGPGLAERVRDASSRGAVLLAQGCHRAALSSGTRLCNSRLSLRLAFFPSLIELSRTFEEPAIPS